MPFFDAVKMAVAEEKSLSEEIGIRPETGLMQNGDSHDGLLSLPVTPAVESAPFAVFTPAAGL